MNRPTTLAAVAAVCLAALAWILFGQGPGEDHAAANDRADHSLARESAPTELERAAPTVAEAPAADGPRRVVAAPAEAPAPDAHPWEGELAGVTGRLVEEDGTPIPDKRVELLQLDATLVLSAKSTALGNESIEIDEATTGPDGRFTLDGATAASFHGLGIDRGGARSTVRFIDRSIEHGVVTDLGDIVLAGYGILLGTVLDEDGEPVAGARVRVAPVPEVAVQSGVLDVRKDSLIAVKPDETVMAIEIPALVAAQIDRLPVPTTYTASDGTFRLEGVPLTQITGGIDHPGHVSSVIPAFTMEQGERDLGEIDLEYGRTLGGRVVDLAGEPIEGAEVYAGAMHAMFPVGILQPAGPTDAAGQFSIRGVAEIGTVAGFARRAPSDPWLPARNMGSESLEFVLPSAAPMTVHVRDTTGAPVSGAELTLTADSEDERTRDLVEVMAMTRARSPRPKLRVSESEGQPGTYVIADVSLGAWFVEAEVDGLAKGLQRVEHQSDATVLTVVCPIGKTIAVRVLDAADREPIAGAHAAVIGESTSLFSSLAAAWSDAEGRATLGPYEVPVDGVSPRARRGGSPEPPILRVQHPRFGEHCEPLLPGATEVEVLLTPPCKLTGRVHWGGAVPDRLYMIVLTRENVRGVAEAFAVPRMTVTDLTGEFRIGNLTAGDYEMAVMERFFHQDPLQLATAGKEPVMRYRTEVAVGLGEDNVVDVDLSPTGLGPTGRIAGRVLLDGAPLSGAKVELRGSERVELFTDSRGAFESGELPTLRGVNVTIEGEVDLPDGSRETRRLYQRWVNITPGGVENVEVDLHFEFVSVEVVDAATGRPLADVSVEVPGQSGRDVKTGSNGIARVLLEQAGRQRIQASCAGYASGHADFEPGKGEDRARIELHRSVPCSGRVVLGPGVTVGDQSWSYVQVRGLDTGSHSGAQVRGEDMTFTLSDLGPGRYKAHLWVDGRSGEEVDFELGPAGDTSLLLEFRPQSND